MNPKTILLYLLLTIICPIVKGQEGIVSGNLKDSSGIPIPGVSVVIKNTTTGTQTDFDGNYSIKCNVGDILVISYIGQKTKEIRVTAEMFSGTNGPKAVKKIAVKNLISDSYTKLLEQNQSKEYNIPDISGSKLSYTFSKKHKNYNRIKSIDTTKKGILVKTYPSDVFFEIGLTQLNSIQFVKDGNLPLLQNTFSQGRSVNGALQWQGAERNEFFSFGPRIQNLEYDGLPYLYDQNGRLVPMGLGNGQIGNSYSNQIFESSLTNTTILDFDIYSGAEALNFNYTNAIEKDIFNEGKSKDNSIALSYKNNRGEKSIKWKASVLYEYKNNAKANINGFYNNLLLNTYLSPPSFSNAQGYQLGNGQQRSFNPQFYNNPQWLLQENKNRIKSSLFKAGARAKTQLFGNLELNLIASYLHQKEEQGFGLPVQTVGFEEGYLSDKNISKDNIQMKFNLQHADIYLGPDLYLSIFSSTDYSFTNLDYNFSEASGFTPFNFEQPANIFSNTADNSKSTLQLINKMVFNLESDVDLKLTIQNNSFSSSIQGQSWFLPSAKFFFDFNHLFYYSDFLSNITLSGGISKDVVDFPLFYNNLSHNSLIINPEESLRYTANNDLFSSADLELEEVEQIDLETQISLFNNRVALGASYYRSKSSNSIFPVVEATGTALRNIAKIETSGFESSLSMNFGYHYNNKFFYSTRFTFSKYQNKTLKLYNGQNTRLPIAGFNSISQNLIEGEAAGVLVGSAFLKNEQGQRIIGDDGFPIVDPELQIIGNPIPDFNLGWSNTMKFKRFTFNFVFDYQHGGDIWNGTQNILNYHGISQETATLRNTTQFIFQGVNQSGIPNNIPVDFANPAQSTLQNRWVRYGFEGVAEEAIEDGSFLNLKSMALSYEIKPKEKGAFFKEIMLGFFAENLISWTKFRGASPYSSLYGNTSAAGLNFFNLPLLTEVGMNLKLKI